MRFQLLLVLALTGGALAGASKFCSKGDAAIVMDQWSALYNRDASGMSKLLVGRQIFDRQVGGADRVVGKVGGPKIYN